MVGIAIGGEEITVVYRIKVDEGERIGLCKCKFSEIVFFTGISASNWIKIMPNCENDVKAFFLLYEYGICGIIFYGEVSALVNS